MIRHNQEKIVPNSPLSPTEALRDVMAYIAGNPLRNCGSCMVYVPQISTDQVAWWQEALKAADSNPVPAKPNIATDYPQGAPFRQLRDAVTRFAQAATVFAGSDPDDEVSMQVKVDWLRAAARAMQATEISAYEVPDLALLETPTLMNELLGRCDHGAIMLLCADTRGGSQIHYRRRWKGNNHTIVGLVHDLAFNVLKELHDEEHSVDESARGDDDDDASYHPDNRP